MSGLLFSWMSRKSSLSFEYREGLAFLDDAHSARVIFTSRISINSELNFYPKDLIVY